MLDYVAYLTAQREVRDLATSALPPPPAAPTPEHRPRPAASAGVPPRRWSARRRGSSRALWPPSGYDRLRHAAAPMPRAYDAVGGPPGGGGALQRSGSVVVPGTTAAWSTWTLALAGWLDGTGVVAYATNPGTAWTPGTQALTRQAVPAWRWVWPAVRLLLAFAHGRLLHPAARLAPTWMRTRDRATVTRDPAPLCPGSI
jgi:hypothetical protein